MKEFIYKKQGDGRDSWLCIERLEDGQEYTRYMVYEDPNKKIDLSNIDIDTLSQEQILKLKQKLGL